MYIIRKSSTIQVSPTLQSTWFLIPTSHCQRRQKPLRLANIRDCHARYPAWKDLSNTGTRFCSTQTQTGAVAINPNINLGSPPQIRLCSHQEPRVSVRLAPFHIDTANGRRRRPERKMQLIRLIRYNWLYETIPKTIFLF